ncbi:MAG: uncharacterized protein JWQ43_3997 [Glaciihabitans sp.]|nr:uncharacterized protein [Glaciihabitans sp.]
MQLGTRWSVGAEAPARLSADVVAAIASVENDLAGVETGQWRWTLTWLEGRPVVELDDGTVIRVNSGGEITVRNLDDEQDYNH